MLIPTIIMGMTALALLYIGYSRGQGQHIEGVRTAFNMMARVIPLIVFAFIVAGMVRILMPRHLIASWVGHGSGVKGIMIGTLVGAVTPGGAFVSFPIAVVLLRSGTSIGTIVAFLTAGSLWTIYRLPMEIGFLGWKFTLIHIASILFFPPLAGFIAQTFLEILLEMLNNWRRELWTGRYLWLRLRLYL